MQCIAVRTPLFPLSGNCKHRVICHGARDFNLRGLLSGLVEDFVLKDGLQDQALVASGYVDVQW